MLKAATPIGTLFGQLVFGVLADRVGRKRMCTHTFPLASHPLIGTKCLTGRTDGIELIVIIIATFGLALATANDSNGGNLGTVSIVPVLLMWRLIVSSRGPLSAL